MPYHTSKRSFYTCTPGTLLIRFILTAVVCAVAASGASYLLAEYVWSNPGYSAELRTAFFQVFQAAASIVMFALPAAIFWRRTGYGIKSGLRLSAPRWRPAAYAVIIMFAIQPFIQFIVMFTRDFLEYALSADSFAALKNMQAVRENAINAITGGKSWGSFPVSIIVLGLIPALTEEFFFRGTLQRLLLRVTHRGYLAVLVTGIVFTTVHFDYFNFLGIFVCSVVLGYLYLYSSSLWVPVAFHFASNSWNILMMYLMAASGYDGGAETARIPWWSALISAAMVVLVVRIMRNASFLERRKGHITLRK